MQIDDIDLAPEIIRYYKDSLVALDETELIAHGRKMPELIEGLNQRTPNIKTLRERINRRIDGKVVPSPIVDLLREATLSERLFAAMSVRAIKYAGNDWALYFGLVPYIGSLLLDKRESVRGIGRDAWDRFFKKGSVDIIANPWITFDGDDSIEIP